MSVDKYILEDGATAASAGLYYSANLLTTAATLQGTAFTGGKLLRRVAGVTNGIGVFRIDTTANTDTTNFLDGNGQGDLVIPATQPTAEGGTYDAGNDWVEGTDIGTQKHAYAHLYIPPGYTVTNATITFDVNRTEAGGTRNGIRWVDIDGTLETLVEFLHTTAGNVIDTLDTGAISREGPGYLLYRAEAGRASTMGCYARITAATVTMESNDYIWRYSSTNGSSPTENTIGIYQGTAGDDDDFAAGVVIAPASNLDGAQLFYTSSYTGTFAALSGLTGLDETVSITCVRVPYRKLLTQALNNSATSIQFIYGTSAAVSGKTLWGVTFNASSGAIAAQSDMTPIVSGTTYYVIGGNALETWGDNTQRMVALAKPVGGGATHLLSSINGGGSWTDLGAVDYTRVHFVAAAEGGNGSVITLAGGDGIAVSVDLGSTLQDKIGDFVSELSAADPLGAFVF